MHVLKLTLLLIFVVAENIINETELIDINHVYYPDPLAVFRPPKKSRRGIVERNELWKHELGNRLHQIKFVTSLLNTPLVIPFVPRFGQIIDDTNDCWVFVVYNSDIERHYGGIKSLLTTTNEYFYERCGVSSVDLAYPSNLAMFYSISALVETPALIYRYPMHKMINYTSLAGEAPYPALKINPLDTWGKLYDSQTLQADTVKCLMEMNDLYEQNGPNLKLGALFMKHYVDDREKEVLRQVYHQAVEQIQQEALQKVYMDGLRWSDELAFVPYMSLYERQLNDDQVSEAYIAAFRAKTNSGAVMSLMEEKRTNMLLSEATLQSLAKHKVDVQKMREKELKPREQPDIDEMLQKWFQVYAITD